MSRVKHGHRKVQPHPTELQAINADGQSPTYCTWRNMKYRAGKIEGYEHVKVCERWDSFENFLADMGERPAGMTLDRKDPWGHYEKDNCRWADAPTQARNKRKKFKCGQDCECPQCLRNRMY